MTSRHTDNSRLGGARQRVVLAIAIVLLAIVAVLVLVVVLRGHGSDAPPAGSPDAVTDSFAAAVQGHDAAGIGALTCTADRDAVSRPLRGVLRDLTSATRTGSAEVQGDVAAALVGLRTAANVSGSMTVALREIRTTWCVTSIAISLPRHG